MWPAALAGSFESLKLYGGGAGVIADGCGCVGRAGGGPPPPRGTGAGLAKLKSAKK
jgi:hypothetical protein